MNLVQRRRDHNGFTVLNGSAETQAPDVNPFRPSNPLSPLLLAVMGVGLFFSSRLRLAIRYAAVHCLRGHRLATQRGAVAPNLRSEALPR